MRGCTPTPPVDAARTVLVQGDTGPGNFVFENGKVTGIVDWEFAHLGDPMDDWAWLDMRMPRRGPRRAAGPHTHGATGIEIDHDRIRYYRAAVDYRCAVTTSLAVSRGGGARGGRRTSSSPSATCSGSPIGWRGCSASSSPPKCRSATRDARTPLYDHLLDGIRAATRGIDDVELRESTRNLQILVHYLRAYDEIGAEVEALDRADRRRDARRRCARRRRASPRSSNRQAPTVTSDTFRYLLPSRAQRERLLWATLLDRPRR